MFAVSWNSIDWRRTALLVLAICLLAAGLLPVLLGVDDFPLGQSMSLRIGTTLFIGWLAYPALQRLNVWVVGPLALAALLFIARPALIIPVARGLLYISPLLVLIWLLQLPARKRK